MIKKSFLSCSVMFSMVCFAAEDIVVNDHTKFLLTKTSAGMPRLTSVSADAESGYPSDIAAPQFWFDASRPSGWTIEDGRVTRIPSLVGDRSLVFGDFPESWSNCTGGAIFKDASAPRFVAGVEALNGGACVDFGAQKSKNILLFDAVSENGGAPTNILRNIGSVIAVWCSENNGGSLLGGGHDFRDNGAAPFADGYLWSRGNDTFTGNALMRHCSFMSPIVGGSSYLQLRDGTVVSGGLISKGMSTGFNGAWEVVGIRPKTGTVTCAAGIGFSDWRIAETSGGQKVAEMLIFDRTLSHAEHLRVARYLERKWFKREYRALDGNAYVKWVRIAPSNAAAGGEQTVDVPSGRLTVGRLQGGYGTDGTPVVKTGAGALEVKDMSAYAAPLKLAAGSLSFRRRDVPAALPPRAYLRFDASAADSVSVEAVDGTNFVSRWAEELKPVYYGNPIISARPHDDSNRPWLLEDALGEGRHVIDFGPPVKSGTCYLRLATNDTVEVAAQKVKQPGVITVFAVVGAQNGGGTLIGGDNDGRNFHCRSQLLPAFSGALVSANEAQAVVRDMPETRVISNAVVMVDGFVSSGSEGYPSSGYHVLAYQAPANASTFSRIGGYQDIGMSADVAGGMRLGELVVYRRALTEDEMRDGSAYLLKKWMGRVAPGYSDGTAAVSAVQIIEAADGTAIDVGEGTSVRIGSVAAQAGATVRKTGKGELVVGNADFQDGKLVIAEGTVKVEASRVGDGMQIAASPSLHLDAACAHSLETVRSGEEERVVNWYSKDFSVFAFASAAGGWKYAPVLERNALNGMPVLDFKNYKDYHGTGLGWQGGRRLSFSRSLDSVKAAFVVWAQNTDSATALTLGASSEAFDYSGGDNSNWGFYRTGKALVANHNLNAHIMGGSGFTNGVAASLIGTQVVPGEFQLTEIYPNGSAHVSALCGYSSSDRFHGGAKIAEVILYERELTEREKVVTRNYLMGKWFNGEPVPLPEETAASPIAGDADIADGYKWNVTAAESGLCDGGIAVTGEISFGENIALAVTGMAELLNAGVRRIKLAEAESFSGVENLDVSRICTDLVSARYRPKFKLMNGGRELYLSFDEGTVIFIR